MTEHPYNLYRKISQSWSECETISKKQPFNSVETCLMVILLAEVIGDDTLRKRAESDLVAIRRHLSQAGNGV